MKLNNLKDLYIEELRDIYSAEQQIIKAMPKVIDECTSEELRSALEDHLDQTKEHVERLNEVFQNLGSKAKAKGLGKKCLAMEGLVKECQGLLKEEMDENVKDAAIIGACQKIEHYEIAAYGTVCTYAKLLDRDDDLDLLGQTLDEEKEADENLADIAESNINPEAADAEEEEEDEKGKK